MLFSERKIAVKQSSRTETTQLIQSNETCVELRRIRYDETAVSTGATILNGLSRMLTISVRDLTRKYRRWPIPDLQKIEEVRNYQIINN